MDTELLRTFIQVAQTRNFRRAAEQLFITQSAVSARIKLLEEKLAATLLVRDRHGVSLTTAGTRFLEHAEQLLALWNRASQDVAKPANSDAVLIVGATDTIWQVFLTQWLVEMRRKTPSLALAAELHTRDTLLPALLDGTLDIAVMFDPPSLPHLRSEELADIPLVLVSNKSGQTPEQVFEGNYISVDWGHAFASAFQNFFGISQPGELRTSVGKVALDLLFRMGGAAYLPEPMVRSHLASQQLFTVRETPAIVRPMHALWLIGKSEQHLPPTGIAEMQSCIQGILS